MIKNRLVPKGKSGNEDFILTPSDEAKICLTCPLKKCKNANHCERFKNEKEKLLHGGKNGT